MQAGDQELPLDYQISFDKYLRYYDKLKAEGDAMQRAKAERILERAEATPALRQGFGDPELLSTYKDDIDFILQDSFSEILGSNEIKAASLPYFDIIFSTSKRFSRILEDAGPDYEITMQKDEDTFDYIMASTVILNFYYGFHLDYSRPYFYEIPDKNGVMHYYRIMYNADFMEIIPTENSPKITQDDVDILLANPHNVELWKEKIPPKSFIAKGFVLANMFNVTSDHSISEIKSELISSNKRGSERFMQDLQETFRSFFRLNDIRAGFITYNTKEDKFERVYGKGIESFILQDKDSEDCEKALCQGSYHTLLKNKKYFVIPDVDKYFKISEGEPFYKGLKEQKIKSAIFAPIAYEDQLLGLLEIVSGQKGKLNGVNAAKLNDVMPYIVSAVIRSKIEEENLIDAVIQHECTTVHSSVLWRFKEEARKFIINDMEGKSATFKEIQFKEVYPLYGQIDIKDSSRARNKAIQKDLLIQLSHIKSILEASADKMQLPIYEELKFRVQDHMDEIKEILHTNSEQAIFNFVHHEINPVFNHLKKIDEDLATLMLTYESGIDSDTESYYDHRRNYDQSVMKLNERLAGLLDDRQEAAQEMFPHYFERYKTDGVEHNMYIGASISESKPFDKLYLNNLKLWQLQVMVEMENDYYKLKPELPVPLDVTSLILVYNTSLAIRFRMDEKRFDVDGTYNARYEVIKKRIDKSYIKGTDERLTQPGKMVIVYSQKEDELEYLRYIKFLKHKGYFTDDVEIVELEGLQGVSGLKAIRAEIRYQAEKDKDKVYTYEDLMRELSTK